MINKGVLFLLYLIQVAAWAQFGPQQLITEEANGVELVVAVDVDGDGDMDIASASRNSDTIAWQENIDGLGDFGPQQIVSATVNQTEYVQAADLDGDGDMDLLAYSGPDSLIIWFENIDGLGGFSSQKVISTTTSLPGEIVTADIDGDLDMDVVVSSRGENAVIWFENTTGFGDFGPKQTITNSALSGRSIYASDLDGDMDIDLVATSSGNKRLYWYENLDGLGTFGPDLLIVETIDFGGFISVFAMDIDGDSDNDVLAAEFGGSTLSWFENTDGQGSFGSQQIITSTLDTPYMVFSIDLDDDGDVDVLSGSGADNKVVWFENIDGLGTFGVEQVITTLTDGPRSVYAADIDNDGDNDVLSASIRDDKIAWYENLVILNVFENVLDDISLYPNPVRNHLNINAADLTIQKVAFYDMLGKQIPFEANTSLDYIDMRQLAIGVYLLKIEAKEGVVYKRIVKQ